jgi:hypothetical protein
MLSADEVAGYNAFGFVVLNGCLTPSESAAVEAAYERVMVEAPRYDYFDTGGTRKLNGCEEKDPVLARFLVHPKIIDAMGALWGAPGLFLGSDIWSNRDDTPWHTDGLPGRLRGTVKVTTYLDEMTAEQGALNLLPGTHLPESSSNLFRSCGYFDRSRPRLRLPPEQIPGVVSLHTMPGDVVIWDTRLWHSAFKRKDGQARRALFFSFVPDYQGDVFAEQFARQCFSDHRGSREQPIYGPNFLACDEPQILQMVERLEELGVENVRPDSS